MPCVFVKLGDVCHTTSGGTPARSKPEYYGGDIPWVKSGDLTDGIVSHASESVTQSGIDNSSAKLFKPGTLLVAMYGATVGKLSILGIEAATNQAICGITPTDSVDTWYLYYLLLERRKKLVELSTGGAQPNISQKIIRELEIPLPRIEEQRRLVDILKRVDGIRRLRKQAQDTARQLIPALFIDMFGDSATNPIGWPVRKVSEFVKRFEGGKNIQAGSENGSPYRILKVSAVTSGVYRESESKPAPDGYSPPEKHIVKVGDMLFSRANTEALVGATAIVEKTDGKTLLPDKLWRFVWTEPVAPAYMHAVFQSSYARRELGRLSTGTSASMRNISQGKLFEFSLPIAPYEVQKEFADRAAEILSIESQQSAATVKAEATFQSLLYQAFNGKLLPAAQNKKNIAQPTTAIVLPIKQLGFMDELFHRRASIDVYVLNKLRNDSNLGRTKMEKISHLMEYHCGINLERAPVRDQYGPNDYPSRRKTEDFAEEEGWYKVEESDTRKGVKYRLNKNITFVVKSAENTLEAAKQQVDELIQLLAPLDTKESEIVATLYGAWNDLLIDGCNSSDPEIINDVLFNWHPSKQKIPSKQWQKWLYWMRNHALVPIGRGKKIPVKGA